MLIEPFGVAHGKLPAVRKRERPAFTLTELPAVRKRECPAFMLIELLVLIAVIAVSVTILVPVIRTSIAGSYGPVCQTKLGSIVNAFARYDDDADYGGFPRLGAKGNPDDLLRDGDTLDTATLGTNTMQNMWILIDPGFLPPSAFKCPADRDYLPRSAQTRYGWENYNQFSYGMQNPYDADSETSTKTNAASPAEDSYKANQVLMADMNPGGPAATKGHSIHPDGCNVATRNGNVWFHEGERSSVMYGEEIYDDDGDPSDAWPDSSKDVVITPTHPKGNRQTVTRLPEGTVPIALVVGLAVAVAIVVVVVVVAMRYRKPKSEQP